MTLFDTICREKLKIENVIEDIDSLAYAGSHTFRPNAVVNMWKRHADVDHKIINTNTMIKSQISRERTDASA